MSPIDAGLHALGLLGSDASGWERGFAAAMVIRWLSVVLLLLYVKGIEREPLSSIGIRLSPWIDIPIAAGIGILTLVVGGGLYLLVHGSGFDANTQVGMIVRTLGVAGRAQVAINAAVVEELLFRGLLIERFTRLFGRPWLSAAVSVVLFVGSHYVTGSSSLVLTLTGDLVGGLALVGLYMLRGHNVVTNTIAHTIINLYVVFGLRFNEHRKWLSLIDRKRVRQLKRSSKRISPLRRDVACGQHSTWRSDRNIGSRYRGDFCYRSPYLSRCLYLQSMAN